MAKVQFRTGAKYGGVIYPANTPIVVKDEDVESLVKVGAFILEPAISVVEKVEKIENPTEKETPKDEVKKIEPEIEAEKEAEKEVGDGKEDPVKGEKTVPLEAFIKRGAKK